jgi:hypothetical protein
LTFFVCQLNGSLCSSATIAKNAMNVSELNVMYAGPPRQPVVRRVLRPLATESARGCGAAPALHRSDGGRNRSRSMGGMTSARYAATLTEKMAESRHFRVSAET